MDRRVFILPIASVLLVLAVLMRPDFTGFIAAGTPEDGETPQVSVTISGDGMIPEDSVITVYLDDQEASMGFRDFVEKTGKDFRRIHGEIPEIGYEGYGFGGSNTYSLEISDFGLVLSPGSGEHVLTIEVAYGNFVISRASSPV